MGLKVHGALFLVALLYAILFSWAGQIMPGYLSPEAFVFLRVVTAFSLFSLCGLLFVKEKVEWKSDFKRFAICAFFGTAANMYLFFKGLSMTKPINGAVLMLVTPIFVAVFEQFSQRRKPGLELITGIAMGALGAFLLMWNKGVGFSSATLPGDICVAVNAAFYAVYLILAKKLANKYHAITVNRITFGLGVLYMAPLGLFPLLGSSFQHIPFEIELKIGYTLLFTSFLVYLLNTYGMKRANSSLVGVYIYLQPLLASVIAVFLGRDILTFEKCFYAGMILFGVWMVSFGRRSKTPVTD